MNSHYFESPEHAVIVVNQLLEARDWNILANYYLLMIRDQNEKNSRRDAFFSRRTLMAHKIPWGFGSTSIPFLRAFFSKVKKN